MPGFDTGSTMYALNVDFTGNSLTSGRPQVLLDGQLLIGSSALPNIRVGTLSSTGGTITITNGHGTINLETTGGQSLTQIGVDVTTGAGTNPVVPTAGGLITMTGGQYASGTFGTRVITIDSTAPNTLAVQAQISSAVAVSTSTSNGVAHFNSADFTVDANGFVTAIATTLNYTNVTHAQSTYTVLSTDEYISVDCSGGVVTLNFPNAPTFKRSWVVKDRTGNASANNISITTPGGAVTFDGQTTYKIISNYGSINLLFNGTSYEVW